VKAVTQKIGALTLAMLFSVSAWAADGLTGRYYSGFKVVSNNIVFEGLTLSKTETNTLFDLWNGSQYYDWNPIGNGAYSVEWTGFLLVPDPGSYGFGTISDDGSQMWIDGDLVVNNYEEQWYDWQEGYCYLGRGYHQIRIAFYENASYSGIELWWLSPTNAPSVLPYSGDNFHSTPPTYQAATKWQIIPSSVLFTAAPYVVPKVSYTRTSPNVVALSWPSSTNASYLVESSTNLTNWAMLQNFGAGNGTNMVCPISTEKEKEFFRVSLQPNP
jgi:hypothetical protein